MTNDKKLSTVKIMLGISGTTEDATLNMYLNQSANAIMRKAFPFSDNCSHQMPEKYDYIQCEIAVYLYNKRGAEGETVHNENGVNRTYESSGIPSSLLNQVVPYVGVL